MRATTVGTVIISALYLYPVKGCRGISVQSAEADALGFMGDRRFLIVDDSGKFLTQRTSPKLALIETRLSNSHLTLSAEKSWPVEVPLASDPTAKLRTVEVWSSNGLLAEDCGQQAHEWLSEQLGQSLHLVRIGPAFHRPVKPTKAQPGDVVTFADAYPFLVISESSLADLNTRLATQAEAPVPMNRFRPNIVVAGCDPYAEDSWRGFVAGSLQFRSAGTCARCIVTTIDQSTAIRGKEPLKTLASYRRSPTEPSEVIFGQNLIHETKSGRISVGDVVTPIVAA
jgi:uncharacterized protein